MKIYISGPITGTSDYKERFEWVEKKLRAAGYMVINPARVNLVLPPEETEHYEYMTVCKAMIHLSDAIYMMKGWEQSKGAKEEYVYANMIGKEILGCE